MLAMHFARGSLVLVFGLWAVNHKLSKPAANFLFVVLFFAIIGAIHWYQYTTLRS